MDILTSNARFRQCVIKRSYKTGVTEASKYYGVSRNAIYEWRAKYDGTWKLRFYDKMRMYGIKDGIEQIKKYNLKSNNIPKICLNFRTPNEVMQDYLAIL